METKNENSDVSRAEEMKNQANEAFKGFSTFAIELNTIEAASLNIASCLQVTSSLMRLICTQKL